MAAPAMETAARRSTNKRLRIYIENNSRPPSTTMVWPVTYEPASLASSSATLGDLRRLAEVLHRLRFLHFRPAGFVLPVKLTQRRLYQPGSDGVYPNSLGTQLSRVRLRHHDQRRLRHAVEHAFKLRAEAGDGHNVDDRSPTTLAHSRRDQLYEAERALEIEFDHFIELPLIHRQHRLLSDVGRGIVHQNIYAPKLGSGLIHQLLYIFSPADVAGMGNDLAGLLGVGVRDFIQRFLFTPANHHRRALLGKHFGNGAADSPAGSRHNCHFVL